ncbi:Arc family DNA binding domain-containing protein [Xenorhabdus khoisanae]|uniref:Arc family DNA binding domain-containing protein n=1 Tax=Xenorhabdus khoisanae TaxID=880157 RepID=UPI0023595DE9|nr:Arc family DNA binding domain-containing protein [Xenorhabdus khoisanae]MDC9615592.1 Arc family DNA binding domain-containing protein [Xenorhabdus khoisanae]
MQKAKDMYQRKIRFPEEICKAIQENGEKESRQFNTEVIYQLKKAYGLIEKMRHEAQ